MQTRPWSISFGAWLFYGIGALWLGLSMVMHYRGGYTGDKDWRLLATQSWLDGQKLYSGTFFDINPPLIIWLYSIPVGISRWLHLADYHVVVEFGMLAVLLVLWLSLKIIRAHPQFSGAVSRRQFAALLCFLFIVYPNASWFFEREYIFVVLTFPYALRWMPTLAGKEFSLRLRLMIGLLGAIGFCIKPHCMLLFAGIATLTLLRERSFNRVLSVEYTIVYLAAIVYVCCVRWFTPDYFSVVLPMARQTYGAVTNYKDAVFYALNVALTFAVILADFRSKYSSPYRRDILYFLGLCPFLTLYIISNNGWFATYYPLMAYGLFLAGLLWWEAHYLARIHRQSGEPVTPFLFSARACAIALGVNAILTLPMLYSSLTYRCSDHIECKVDKSLKQEVMQDGEVFSYGNMSSLIGRWVELNRNTGAKMQVRFHHLWMLNKFYESTPDFYRSHEWILRYVAQAYAEDLARRKPAVVFVDENDHLRNSQGDAVSLPVYFSTYPAFKASWQFYRFDHIIDYCLPYTKGKPGCRYDVYRRIADSQRRVADSSPG